MVQPMTKRNFDLATRPISFATGKTVECQLTAGSQRRNWFMPHQFTTSFLQDSTELFRTYKNLGDRALAQCPDAALFVTLDAESNSIAVIVKHLAGNMRSRWTNFLTTDGEKPDRDRDTEFENPPATRTELLELWERGWKYVFAALEQLTDADLDRRVTIRATPHSVMQAISRQIAHYAYHVGQIVFLAKHGTAKATGKWNSLTVPRGQSKQFNADVTAGKRSQR